MDVPAALRPRVLGDHDGRIRLALDDDRGARLVVLALGTISVATLSAGWTLGGPVWPWVGVLSVPVIAALALALAMVVGRRTVEVHVDAHAVTVAAVRLPLLELEQVRLDGSALVLDHPGGAVRVSLSGEDDEVRDALRAWLDDRRRRA